MQVIFQWYWECPHPCPYRSIGATFVKILKLFIGWSKKCLGGSWKVPGVPRTPYKKKVKNPDNLIFNSMFLLPIVLAIGPVIPCFHDGLHSNLSWRESA